MAFGQPFYNYGANSYNGQNNGYMAQQPQYDNFCGQQQNAPQNANNGVVQQQQSVVLPPKTNMSTVTSLMEAMSRMADPNTDIFYADQDNPYIYRISVDMQGRKTYKTFKLEDVTEQQVTPSGTTAQSQVDLSAYATKDDLKALKDEITSYAMTMFSKPAQTQPEKPKQQTEKPFKKENDGGNK